MWIEGGSNFSLVPFPVTRLLENPPITVYSDTFHRLKSFKVIGSCNGLICLIRERIRSLSFVRTIDCQYLFDFWNPSIRMMSVNLVEFRYTIRHTDWPQFGIFKFTFGCDDATNTYKVVAYRVEGGDENNKKSSGKSEVKVFNVG
ncbi:F-box protein, partial [Trifolium medium]|nr:F-box protein [Trifolium medium]